MALGTTADFNLTRDEIVSLSYEMIGNPAPSTPQKSTGNKFANLIIRELDIDIEHLWAITDAPSAITLQANIAQYTSSEGLPVDIKYLHTVLFRNQDMTDTPVNILTSKGYDKNIADKLVQGSTVDECYLTDELSLASRKLIISPVLKTVNDQSEVTGTDALNYSCIRNHVAVSTNKPITGSDYLQYWEQSGSAGVAWTDGTSYTAPQLILIRYLKPLFDFDAGSNNPDMPVGWVLALVHQLAYKLSFTVGGFNPDAREQLRREAVRTRARVGLGNKKVTTDFHNKGTFY
jgi:hypothetical protein